jgi:hypothetical protein
MAAGHKVLMICEKVKETLFLSTPESGEGKQVCSCPHSEPQHSVELIGQNHALANLPLEWRRNPVTIEYGAELSLGQVWMFWKREKKFTCP